MRYLKPILEQILYKRTGEILINSGLITEEQLKNALEIQKQTGKKLGEILIEHGSITKHQLTRALKQQINSVPDFRTDEEALNYLKGKGIPKEKIIKELESYYGVSYVDLEKTEIDPDLFSIFDFSKLRERKIIPFHFNRSTRTISFAIADLGDQYLRENISSLCRQRNFSSKFFFAFTHEIEQKFKKIEMSLKNEENLLEIDEVGAREWVDRILKRGIQLKASDIHIEPCEKGLQVRYRIDGILSLKEHHDFSENFIQSITARIKIISNMNIAEKRRPQDGRLDNFEYENNKYDLRVSTVSTIYGEKIVMRVFNKNSRILSFKELGFFEEDENKIKSMLNMPFGIIYLAGATGSGKTTTLYTMIDHINSEEINIYTIEDPVEKTLKNINQIQINPQSGITYASTLKALLRQDPDVIVVGEIRDQETADLSVRSSLTGHLVLSTIHANNALETISRLYNMGIEPYLIGASTLGFISQRLVRVLCSYCKKEKEPDTIEKEWLNRIERTYNLPSSNYSIYKPCGCPKCNNLGYKGRTAVAEVLTILDSKRKELITNRDTETLYKTALKKDFSPMELNAYRKVIKGITSVQEAMRVF